MATPTRPSRRAQPPRAAADPLPVARVAVDLPLAHLDRPFDYLVPAELAADAVPGCRVRVRFAGRLVDGFVTERLAESEHSGSLAFLDKVISAEPVLRPEVLTLARAVADRYAGTLADVLRLAVPPRHARVEAEPRGDRPEADQPGSQRPATDGGPADGGWSAYPAGPAFLRALSEPRPVRAVYTVLPGEDWPRRLAEAVAAMYRAGRGALVVVPDQRDLTRLDAAMLATLGPGSHVSLHAALGPAERYRRFLRASRGEVRVVLGTRAAALAPVAELGLVAIWDDGDDLHAEPRAPYPHALQVLLLRAQLAGAGALIAATARSAEAHLLLETGWAKEVTAARTTVRNRAPAVSPTGDDTDRARDPAAVSARLPSLAWTTARDALAAGHPVLVQVPRRGYLPAVSCVDCLAPARCGHCAGPLQLRSAHGVAACRWCGRPAADFACHRCGGRRLRASVIGAGRTAEELGRAFAGVPVRTSGRDAVLDSVPGEPALVVSTPGAEPVAEGGGYGAVMLLDTWALLSRADLRAGEEALRRWLAAATLARPAAEGGRVIVVADGGLVAVQALIRWDPATFAARELADRRELGFPPAARMASLTGEPDAVADLLALTALPPGAEVLGPVAVTAGGSGAAGGPAGAGTADAAQERALIRVASRAEGPALATALHTAAALRSARKAAGSVRVQIDPRDLW
ncbi:MAG TPA: primosomal protein N' [Micromonosporaceae bacterium]